MPPRLTFLITDLHRGGSPLLLAALAPSLAAKGFEVDVVSIDKEGDIAALLTQRGIQVTSLNAEGSGDFSVIPRFVEHLRRRRPHIVASILIHANLLAALAKPFVKGRITWIHSIHTLQARPYWHWYLQGVLGSFADGFVAPSHAVVHKLERYGPVPNPAVIPNGIDVARFRDASVSPQDPAAMPPLWPQNAFVVGYLGRFDPVKRLPVLIEAMALLSRGNSGLAGRACLTLVGYGRQEAALKTLVATLKLENRVYFAGPTDAPENWYKGFDVFCSPSPAEGFGLTLAEARAAGVPVIACRTPAVVETLSEAHWLTEDATPQEVAAAIAAAAEGSKSAAPLRHSVYTQEAMVVAYARYFQRFHK